MSCVTIIKAALARLLFASHSWITVWRVVEQEKSDWYWRVGIAIIMILMVEGFHALCYRKGEELAWLCPSVLIYLSCIIPSIWILELRTNRKQLLCQYLTAVQEMPKNNKLQSVVSDIMQISEEDIKEAHESCRNNPEQANPTIVPENEIPGFGFNTQLKPEQWTRILEQVVLVVLIWGRWLLPKGRLSRDQFSQMMLVFIGMAADIVEVFEAFRETRVMLEPALTFAILGVWSLSLLQFCLVLGSDQRDGRTRSNGPNGDDDGASNVRMIHMDMIAIASALLLQDLPFLCLRLTLIFRYKVISHMNIFFTCKNSLVMLLQMYRFCILCLATRPTRRRQSRIFSLLPQFSWGESIPEESSDILFSN
ncbi:transmembrane protein 26-like isoform X2 [Tigriopus californicus]|uniref:transmembrane protein 26-like isoform X2 n=1 Tax=Tigriopus californicus TaxID=6832 RepID=UPI0027DA400E|nr:transmembrane protein 26-like isoform X2 [Tigriopus californicus]